MSLDKKKGVIFDVDGTLWDACEVIAESWNDYIEKVEPELARTVKLADEDLHRVCGMTMTDIGETLFPMVPQPRRGQLTEELCAYEVEYMEKRPGKYYPGIRQMLLQLKEQGYHCYIVSNCQAGYIEDMLGCSDFEDLIEDYENFGRTGKPKDENIRLLVQRQQLDQAVYVGDTQGDYNATTAAGLPFILADYGFGSVQQDVVRVDAVDCIPEAVHAVLDN